MRKLFVSLLMLATLTTWAESGIEVVVHRGANHLAPENTLASAFAAIDHGATWIELDVRTSKDGIMFNLHDATLDRTTNGYGAISSMPAAKVRKLDAGVWFSPEFKGTRVPEIAEMLDSLKGRANVYFDVKDGTDIAALVALVREKGYEKNCFFWFEDVNMQNKLIALAPDFRIKVNASSVADVERWMRICRPAIVETSTKDMTPEYMDFCHSHGIKVMAALMAESIDEYRTAIQLGADMVNIDRPEVFEKMLTGMHKSVPSDAGLLKVAFVSDPHVEDVETYPELVRSMDEQVRSTRLLNENIFALRAALDDIAAKGVRIVVMPGDLTDDGQLLNHKAVRRILDEYVSSHGMRFLVTTGNHDPLRPFGTSYGFRNFLRTDGTRVSIASDSTVFGDYSMVLPSLRSIGYDEEMGIYSRYGFFATRNDLYWATPFSTYSYDDYTYNQALWEGAMDKRVYTMCDTLSMPDATYLVEPVEGLWLLAIDGNVYVPQTGHDGIVEYNGAGKGYDHIIRYKPFLLPWIKRVTAEARRRGKTLIAFCHYPLADFNCGASQLIAQAWGNDKLDLSRVPSLSVSKAFADAGLRLHVGGHIHADNIGKVYSDGNTLYNIQVPSIVGGIPAYKLLTVHSTDSFHVQTIALDSVAGYDRFFPLYRREYTVATGHAPEWNKEVLCSGSYSEMCGWWFNDLVRLRFIPRDLPRAVRDTIVSMPCWRIEEVLTGKRLRKHVTEWIGADMIRDIYVLRYSNDLGRNRIPQQRMRQYQRLVRMAADANPQDETTRSIKSLVSILECFFNADPCADFEIKL